jgi:hypothetical protein
MENMIVEKYTESAQVKCELLAECILEIDKLIELIHKLDNYLYTEKLPAFQGATAGMHIRHSIEFYQCLTGSFFEEISYEKRPRNILLETIPQLAINELLRIRSWLSEPIMAENLTINFTSGKTTYHASSSYLRELYFLNEHLVHHLAILRIGLSASGYDNLFTENFGVASSTANFRKKK